MREDEIRYFEPERLHRAVKRLEYIEKWIDDTFKEDIGKKEKKGIDTLHKRSFLNRLFALFGIKK